MENSPQHGVRHAGPVIASGPATLTDRDYVRNKLLILLTRMLTWRLVRATWAGESPQVELGGVGDCAGQS